MEVKIPRTQSRAETNKSEEHRLRLKNEGRAMTCN